RPVLVVTLREGESSLQEIDRGAIRNERFVDSLKGHPVGVIEDGAPPTGGVGEQRRAGVSLGRHLEDLPEALELRGAAPAAPGIPVTPALLAGKAYEPQTKYDLRGNAIRLARTPR